MNADPIIQKSHVIILKLKLKPSDSLTLGLFSSFCKSKIPYCQLLITVYTTHVQQYIIAERTLKLNSYMS